MTININNGLGPLSSRGGKPAEGGQVDNAQGSGRSAESLSGGQDSVRISQDAASVRELAASLDSQPTFDEARVAEIRQAISEGNYPIDNQRLAENFLALESKL